MLQGWLNVVGGFLIHLVLGTLYLWGNITIYVTAYMRKFAPATTYNDTLMVYATAIGVQGAFMTIGGIIESRIGPKYCCLLGGYILVTGILLASTATSLFELIAYNGVFFGMGMGICYSAPIAAACRWMPGRKGVFSGIVVAGFGFGAFVFGMLALEVVNPHRVAVAGEYYDSDSPVVDKVPVMYRSLGVCYFVLITIGSLLLSDPPKETSYNDGAVIGSDASLRSLAGITYQSAQGYDLEHEDKHREPRDDAPAPVTDSAYKSSAGTTGAVHSFAIVPADTGDANADATNSIGPMELIRTPLAWHLASCFVTTTIGGMYLCGTYKTYGKLSFDDENFLSMVGSTSSIFSAAGRIMWGAVGDRIGAVEALICMSFFFSIIISTYALSPLMGEFGYAFWTYAIFFFEGGNFALYLPGKRGDALPRISSTFLSLLFSFTTPPSPHAIVTMNTFGHKYTGANYGLIFFTYSMFVVANITILAGNNVSFSIASHLMGGMTFLGFVNLCCFHRQIRNNVYCKKNSE